ncbi:MAG: glycosyl transferase, partial [Candidatus Paceibacteria bacterium]
MKILYTVPAFPPVEGKGGPPVSAYNLCKRLVDRGHNLTVYTTDLYKENERKEDENPTVYDGIKV